MKLTLTNDDGEIICFWSIGHKIDFDIEDLDADPEHNYYTEGNYSSAEGLGQDVWDEIIRAKGRGEK